MESDPTPWRRICVIGCCGAGKSTLARRLGALLDIPVVHLDHHYWRPGWEPLDPAAFRARVAQLAAADRWVLDGNYASTMDLRLPRADLVVLVDFPRRVCLVRAVRRLARSRGRPWNVPGCPERIDRQFLRYLWRWPVEGRPRTIRLVERHTSPEALVRLGNPRAAGLWLDAVARARARDLVVRLRIDPVGDTAVPARLVVRRRTSVLPVVSLSFPWPIGRGKVRPTVGSRESPTSRDHSDRDSACRGNSPTHH